MSTVFPKWMNFLPTILAVIGGTKFVFVVGFVWYFFTPSFWEVGYMPTQPGAGFSHEVHVGKLGLDCRYCHTKVEESPEANIPNVATCMGCHEETRLSAVVEAGMSDPQTGVLKVQFLRDAYAADQSVRWRRVHKLPDYVRNFPHHVHVAAGVSCLSCHGMIGRMVVVAQEESLSMGWCLDCHRKTVDQNLVPPEKVTDLFWVEDQLRHNAEGNVAGEGTPGGEALLQELQGHGLHLLPENCGACHY